MSDPFIAQIMMFGGNFAPKYWAFCQGQLLPISQNQALFAVIGTIYGGNGTTNFALPDLRGRAAVGFGQGTGLSNYALGQPFGQESVTLNVGQMPSHSHNVLVNPAAGNQPAPTNGFLAQSASSTRETVSTYSNAGGSGTFLNPSSIQSNGGSLPHENRQPSLAMNYIIALQGIFPSRD